MTVLHEPEPAVMDGEEDNVVSFRPAIPINHGDQPQPEEPPVADGGMEAIVSQLLDTVGHMDAGFKMMAGLIADIELRVRRLELAQRKVDRKNIPVIVNRLGQPVN